MTLGLVSSFAIGRPEMLIDKIASLIQEGDTVMDVGCGICNLYDAIKDKLDDPPRDYIGIDIDSSIVHKALLRFPEIAIYVGSVYDLIQYDRYDVVAGIELFTCEPKSTKGVQEMIDHCNKKVIVTFYKMDNLPEFIEQLFYVESWNYIPHDLDPKIVIVEIWKRFIPTRTLTMGVVYE